MQKESTKKEKKKQASSPHPPTVHRLKTKPSASVLLSALLPSYFNSGDSLLLCPGEGGRGSTFPVGCSRVGRIPMSVVAVGPEAHVQWLVLKCGPGSLRVRLECWGHMERDQEAPTLQVV